MFKKERMNNVKTRKAGGYIFCLQSISHHLDPFYINIIKITISNACKCIRLFSKLKNEIILMTTKIILIA